MIAHWHLAVSRPLLTGGAQAVQCRRSYVPVMGQKRIYIDDLNIEDLNETILPFVTTLELWLKPELSH